MKMIKKITSIITIAAVIAAPTALSANEEKKAETSAYEDGIAAAGIAPGIALGVIAGSAVMGVIINVTNKGSGHYHSTPSS